MRFSLESSSTLLADMLTDIGSMVDRDSQPDTIQNCSQIHNKPTQNARWRQWIYWSVRKVDRTPKKSLSWGQSGPERYVPCRYWAKVANYSSLLACRKEKVKTGTLYMAFLHYLFHPSGQGREVTLLWPSSCRAPGFPLDGVWCSSGCS